MHSVSPLRADAAPPLELRGGIGVGTMVSSRQRDQGYNSSFMAEVRPAWRFADSLAAELTLSSWFFPINNESGRATLLGAGARFDPHLSRDFSLFADGHLGLGMTGPNNRLMFDGQVGLEYAFNPLLALGPFVRYGQVVSSGMDAKFVAGGVYLALAWPDGEAAPRSEPLAAASPRPAPPPPRAPVDDGRLRLRDGDGDGVADVDDACPKEAQGTTPNPERHGCPDADDDKDGVPNSADKCRYRAFGLNPDPTSMGCPLRDRDADTVPDLYDRCPDEPGAPDPEASKHGCPGLLQVERGTIKLLKPVHFGPDKDVILRDSFALLKAVAAALKATPGIKKLSIEAHTQGLGDADRNQQLSQNRADSVRRWLTQNGIEGERLEAKGFGDSKPVATNKTAKGRAENERVELVILDPAAEAAP